MTLKIIKKKEYQTLGEFARQWLKSHPQDVDAAELPEKNFRWGDLTIYYRRYTFSEKLFGPERQSKYITVKREVARIEYAWKGEVLTTTVTVDRSALLQERNLIQEVAECYSKYNTKDNVLLVVEEEV